MRFPSHKSKYIPKYNNLNCNSLVFLAGASFACDLTHAPLRAIACFSAVCKSGIHTPSEHAFNSLACCASDKLRFLHALSSLRSRPAADGCLNTVRAQPAWILLMGGSCVRAVAASTGFMCMPSNELRIQCTCGPATWCMTSWPAWHFRSPTSLRCWHYHAHASLLLRL